MPTGQFAVSNAVDLALVFEARVSLEHLLTRADSVAPAQIESSGQAYARLPVENDALKLCVASAQALLRVSEFLIDARTETPQLRAKRLEDLVTQTKVAGRGAYRAALMLTDPLFDQKIDGR